MPPPVGRCSNGPTPCWRCSRHGESNVFARSRCLCEGASVSGVDFWRACLRSCPRGIDRFAEHGYARASFSTPQSGEVELPERVVKNRGAVRASGP
jgi:hypothetical protein